MLDLMPSVLHIYLSSDKLCNLEQYNFVTELLYLTGVLNFFKLPSILNHELKIKVGSPILLHNLDQFLGLCNGTHMHVISLVTHMIET